MHFRPSASTPSFGAIRSLEENIAYLLRNFKWHYLPYSGHSLLFAVGCLCLPLFAGIRYGFIWPAPPSGARLPPMPAIRLRRVSSGISGSPSPPPWPPRPSSIRSCPGARRGASRVGSPAHGARVTHDLPEMRRPPAYRPPGKRKGAGCRLNGRRFRHHYA